MAQDKLAEILLNHKDHKGGLIAVLQETQEAYGFLSRENLARIAKSMKIPFAKVFGVATFYAQFHLTPRGKHIVRVCLGTACHVRGAETIFQAASDALGVSSGETTADLQFTLERVACLGACGLSPAIMVDDRTYGRLTTKRVGEILDGYRV
jgi:NADH:ubiquinone oxidoreductase subunit E